MNDRYNHLTDEQKRQIGNAFLNDNLEMRRHAHQAAIDYGKWAMATLFAVNAAVAVAIRDKVDSAQDGIIVVGMFAGVLLSGMTAWLNWSLVARMYDKCSSPNLAIGIQYYERPKASIWVFITYLATLFLAFASGGFVVAAILTILVVEPTSAETAAMISASSSSMIVERASP